jgi:hypothetical protein
MTNDSIIGPFVMSRYSSNHLGSRVVWLYHCEPIVTSPSAAKAGLAAAMESTTIAGRAHWICRSRFMTPPYLSSVSPDG